MFRLPEGTTYLEASGMVVRKEEIGEGKYGLGVEFVEMEEWVLAQIWHFVMRGK
jgi:DNA-binding IclR family transcriptional regulator